MRRKMIYMSWLLLAAGCASTRDGVFPTQRPLGCEIVENSAHVKTGDPTGNITLSQALSLALVQNPELKSFSLAVRSCEAARLQASLLPNPDLEFEVAEYDAEDTGFDTAETVIVLSQLVELGGKRGKRKDVAALEVGLAGWDYESKRLDVFVETTHAFVDVLAAQQSLALAEESVVLAERVRDAVADRVEAGKVPPLEASRASVELSMSRIDLERARKAVEAARMRLASSWGSAVPSFSEAKGEFDAIVDSLPDAASLRKDLSQNPDVARWENEVELRRAAVAMERASAIPDVEARAGIQQFEATGGDALTFGVGISLPIFDRNQGGIKAARSEFERAGVDREAALLKANAQMAEAYTELVSSHLEASALKEEVLPVAENAFEAASSGYKQGKFDYLAVVDAQRTLFDVRAQYIESLAAYHKAVVDIERLIGRSINPESKDANK